LGYRDPIAYHYKRLKSFQGPDKNQIDELNLAAVPSLSDDELSYKIFVMTFLGYGANEAMARHRRSLLLSQLEKPKKIKLDITTSFDPKKVAFLFFNTFFRVGEVIPSIFQ